MMSDDIKAYKKYANHVLQETNKKKEIGDSN